MNLLYVVDRFPRRRKDWNGIGTYAVQATEMMRKRGHEVFVLSGCEPGEEQDGEEGGVLFRFRPEVRRASFDSGLELAGMISAMESEYSIDLVEAPEYGALAFAYSRAPRKAALVTRLHGGTLFCHRYAGNWLKSCAALCVRPHLRAAEWRERRQTAGSDGVSSCSEWILRWYKRLGWGFPGNTRVYFNPFLTEGGPVPAGSVSKKVIWLGRLDKIKGANLLPELINRVCRRSDGARFEVIGQDVRRDRKGTWKSWIQARVDRAYLDRVDFAGGLPRELVAERLRDGAVAVFLSGAESFAYSHVEAMAAGLACVVASGGGARELGENGRHLIFCPRNEKAVAEKVGELLEDPLRRAQLSGAAKVHAALAFGQSTVGDAMEAFYASTVALRMGKAAA